MASCAGRAHLDELALVEPGLLAEGVAAIDLVLVEGDSDDARAGELADVAAAAKVRAGVGGRSGARREVRWIRAGCGAQRAADAAATVEHAIRLLQGRGDPTWSVNT